jgi:Restriction endonuclease fold toxin 7
LTDGFQHFKTIIQGEHPGYGNIPQDNYWRYDRYLESKPNGYSEPDTWWKKTLQIWENNLNGNSFEKQVRTKLRTPIGKGSKPVSINGRVPDLPVGSKFGVTDIKDWMKIDKTDQLTEFYKYAKENNLPFNLIVSPRTNHISEPLLEMIRETSGNVRQFDPATKKITSIDIGESGWWKREQGQ